MSPRVVVVLKVVVSIVVGEYSIYIVVVFVCSVSWCGIVEEKHTRPENAENQLVL